MFWLRTPQGLHGLPVARGPWCPCRAPQGVHRLYAREATDWFGTGHGWVFMGARTFGIGAIKTKHVSGFCFMDG